MSVLQFGTLKMIRRFVASHTGLGVLCLVVVLSVASRALVADEANQEIVQMVIEALRSDDPAMQTGAIALVRDIPGEEVTKALAKELPNLPAPGRVQLLSALADRGDGTALPAVIATTEAKEVSVRIAALKALGRLGDASSVAMLAQRAAQSTGDEQKAARDGLYRLRGSAVDERILAEVPSGEAAVKVELIRSIAERNITKGVQVLLKSAQDPDRKVRAESLKVLKAVADPDALPALVDLLLNLRSDSDRVEAERSVAAVAHKIEDRNRQAASVLAVLPSVKDVKNRCSLLRVLGKIGDNTGLAVLRESLTSEDPKLRDAAIRALSDWPTAEPVGDLLKVAESSNNQVHRILSLRGLVRLLGLDSSRPAKETVAMYNKAMSLAPSVAEKRRVLSGLAGMKSSDALMMAAKYMEDEALRPEAELAAVRIAGHVRESNPQVAEMILKKIIKSSKNETLRQQAQELMKQTDASMPEANK
ncbi:MAG: HEAT repeat domain-containing protein [Phycisphaerales bacterium]|nr:MAG: HEAT repeat domain-containing protein [Phycisphaerales bacterium]